MKYERISIYRLVLNYVFNLVRNCMSKISEVRQEKKVRLGKQIKCSTCRGQLTRL